METLDHLKVGEPSKLTILAKLDDHDIEVTEFANFKIEDSSVIRIERNGKEVYVIGLEEGIGIIHAEVDGHKTDIAVYVLPVGDADVNDVYKNMDLDYLELERQKSLSIINNLRSAIGVEQVTLNEKLNKAAQAHSNYLKINGSDFGHLESIQNTGYTGGDSMRRIQYFDYDTDFNPTGEVISFAGDAIKDTQILIDAPLHRAGLLAPDFNEIGIGINKKYSTVIDLARHGDSQSKNKIIYYPYDAQTEVPASWFAAETPNPLASFGKEGETVGYPISIIASQWHELLFSNGQR